MFNLAISNIAWSNEYDNLMYGIMKDNGFCGLEIAPTRIFPNNPYDKLEEAKSWSKTLKEQYGLIIPSMQSIWFGKKENFFNSKEEFNALINYTKKAIDFASSINCGNLVFGCPKNRTLKEADRLDTGVNFFKIIGEYALSKGTVIGMEANPSIYNTNYINDTISAIKLIKEVNCDGFKLNLDLGTIIYNQEIISELVSNVFFINHVHISEPYLKPIEKRDIHNELKNILRYEGFNGFVSIEMGKVEDVHLIEEKMQYIKDIFE